jgi:hypothetical protein
VRLGWRPEFGPFDEGGQQRATEERGRDKGKTRGHRLQKKLESPVDPEWGVGRSPTPTQPVGLELRAADREHTTDKTVSMRSNVQRWATTIFEWQKRGLDNWVSMLIQLLFYEVYAYLDGGSSVFCEQKEEYMYCFEPSGLPR